MTGFDVESWVCAAPAPPPADGVFAGRSGPVVADDVFAGCDELVVVGVDDAGALDDDDPPGLALGFDEDAAADG